MKLYRSNLPYHGSKGFSPTVKVASRCFLSGLRKNGLVLGVPMNSPEGF